MHILANFTLVTHKICQLTNRFKVFLKDFTKLNHMIVKSHGFESQYN